MFSDVHHPNVVGCVPSLGLLGIPKLAHTFSDACHPLEPSVWAVPGCRKSILITFRWNGHRQHWWWTNALGPSPLICQGVAKMPPCSMKVLREPRGIQTPWQTERETFDFFFAVLNLINSSAVPISNNGLGFPGVFASSTAHWKQILGFSIPAFPEICVGQGQRTRFALGGFVASLWCPCLLQRLSLTVRVHVSSSSLPCCSQYTLCGWSPPMSRHWRSFVPLNAALMLKNDIRARGIFTGRFQMG